MFQSSLSCHSRSLSSAAADVAASPPLLMARMTAKKPGNRIRCLNKLLVSGTNREKRTLPANHGTQLPSKSHNPESPHPVGLPFNDEVSPAAVATCSDTFRPLEPGSRQPRGASRKPRQCGIPYQRPGATRLELTLSSFMRQKGRRRVDIRAGTWRRHRRIRGEKRYVLVTGVPGTGRRSAARPPPGRAASPRCTACGSRLPGRPQLSGSRRS